MKSKSLVAILILVVFTSLISPSLAHSQIGGGYVCGQWTFVDRTGRLGGWWFDLWPFDGQHPSWIMRNVPSGWDLEMNGAYTRIWHPTLDESYSLGPIVLDIGSYEVVPSCDPIVDFWSDNETITAGECTQLHWNVDVAGLESAYLEGDSVNPGGGDTQVCPSDSTTYTLRIITSAGELSQTLSINVIQPTDTPLPPPTDTPLPPPTNTDVPPASTPIPAILDSPTASASTPRFSIIDVQTNPTSINQYERTFLRIKISTGEAKLPENYWSNFSGEAVIKSSSGQMIDKVTFIDQDNASLLPTTVYDEKLKLNILSYNVIQITANLNFNKAIQDGIMEVFVYTNNEPKQVLLFTLPVNVSNQDLKIMDCASVIADKISVALPVPSAVNKSIALNRFRAEITNCDNLSCASEKIREYVWELLLLREAKKLGGEEAGELLVATRDALYGQDSLELCQKPALWLYSIIDEYIRSGIPINMRAVHSPALLMVTSPSGDRTGFLDVNSPVTEIKESIAFTHEDSQYVYFPAQDTTTQLTGTGQGVMTIDVLDVQQGQVTDTSYINIPVSPQTVAQVNLNDSSNEIVVTNGNDTQTIQPDYVTKKTVDRTQGSSGMIFVILLAIAALVIPIAMHSRQRAGRSANTAVASAGRQPVLREMEGASPNQVWPLGMSEVRLGRQRNVNDIALKGLNASRRQASIRFEKGQYVIYTLSAGNPVLVNNTPVRQMQVLKPGDLIRLGETVLRFES